jgi:transcriptional regulator with XRE-family HTH domain
MAAEPGLPEERKGHMNHNDQKIGQRIRSARVARGLSQEALGADIGVTFQQVQKYENGANRVSGSRLVEIARATKRPIPYFFQDIEGLPHAVEEPEVEKEPLVTDMRMRAGVENLLSIQTPHIQTSVLRIIGELRSMDAIWRDLNNG